MCSIYVCTWAQSVHLSSYWMKYHSIIMESLDKYAGLGFGGKTFIFDIEWYRVGHFQASYHKI